MDLIADVAHEDPFVLSSFRQAVEQISEYLARKILAGALPPETVLSQVGVAKALGVSRTPVREALRILKERGLVDLEANYRARVKSFEPDDFTELYSRRIMTEALAVSLTVPTFTTKELAGLESQAERIEHSFNPHHIIDWMEEHRRFHMMLLRGANAVMRRGIDINMKRSDFYVAYYLRNSLVEEWARQSASEHTAVLDAARTGEPDVVVAAHSRHLASTAINMLAKLAPGYEAEAIHTALAMAESGAQAVAVEAA